jgi:low affinity Fe/Cu permease
MLVLNAVPLLFNFSGTWFITAIAALAIYLPATFLDNNDKT